MNRMKVAFILLSDPKGGGAFGYESNVVDAIKSQDNPDFDFVLYAPKNLASEVKKRFPNMSVFSYNTGLVTMFFLSLRISLQGYKLLKTIGLRHGKIERSFIKNEVSLAYFLSPNSLALDLVDTPMINTVWDLGHRDLPEFVEITGDRHFEERELFYRQVLPKSFRVVVETQQTLERIEACYGLLTERIIVGGLAIAKFESVNLGHPNNYKQFILYPAQFWPHKRHILLLKAFKNVCDQNSDCKLVLTGGDKGNLQHVKDVALQLGIIDRVIFTGFVETSELTHLMKTAHCLVFPSQLGPSNMPPLEAAMVGTPSIISSVHSDPVLLHPLIKIVPYQDPDVWATEILNAINNPKPQNQKMDSVDSKLISEIIKSLLDFRELRSEWVS